MFNIDSESGQLTFATNDGEPGCHQIKVIARNLAELTPESLWDQKV